MCFFLSEPWCTLEIWNLKGGRHRPKWRVESTACTGTETSTHTQIHAAKPLTVFVFHRLKGSHEFHTLPPAARALSEPSALKPCVSTQTLKGVFIFSFYSYEKRLFWEEPTRSVKRGRALPADTVSSETTLHTANLSCKIKSNTSKDPSVFLPVSSMHCVF